MRKVVAGVTAALLLAAAGCGGRAAEAAKVRLALDWYPNSNHAGVYEALERGLFEEEGLEVEVYTPADPSTILQTVGAGRDDFGISYQPDVLLARSEGVPVVSVAALVQHPLNSMMALKGSGIDRPGLLKGRKVGITGIPVEERLLETMLEYDGLEVEEVAFVNVGFDLSPALMAGVVDAIVGAYWTHESIQMELEGYEVNVMRIEQWGVPDYYELVLVVSEETLAKRREIVERFVRAFRRGYEAAAADTQGAVTTLVKASPESANEEVERRGIELLAPLWTEGVPRFGWQDAARWESYTAWMKARGLVREGLDASAAFTNEFVAGE
ncbi:MAG: ABC transporter substrate-binding protein [Gemmatimonadetes bacterium]|nr:ABC transporter substrate-binding protein [Gemmatimonadota bacterium]